MNKLTLLTLLAIGIPQIALGQTGRQLDVIAAPTSSRTLPSIGGDEEFLVRPLVGIFWDERCASVSYTFNTSEGAQEGTEFEIEPDAVADIVQDSMDLWNDNPSSYIEMNIDHRTELDTRNRIGGDFVNEVRFGRTHARLRFNIGYPTPASTHSTSLIEDTTFIAGEDLDQDGDSDVFDPEIEGINICTDIDNDGDIEFPAGFYRTGTILDTDVLFSDKVIWQPNDRGEGYDIGTFALQEFGHAQGLSHSTINQISRSNGSGSVMFPHHERSLPENLINDRRLHVDDLAASAFLYPEGEGTEPISEIQPGDIPFNSAYSVLSGTVTDKDGNNILSAAISAKRSSGGEFASMAFSGTSVVFEDQETGAKGVTPEAVLGSAFSIPVPANQSYVLEIEALDDDPVHAFDINYQGIFAWNLWHTFFQPEHYNNGDSAFELAPDRARIFSVGAEHITGIDFILNNEIIQRNDRSTSPRAISSPTIANSVRRAEKFDRDDVIARLARGDVPFAGGVYTRLEGNDTDTFTISQGALALGRIDQNGNAEIRRIFGSTRDILAEDNDITQIPFSGAFNLRNQIDDAFDRFPEAELFFILDIDRVPEGLNFGARIGGELATSQNQATSFISRNNGPLEPISGNWPMELRYVNDGRAVPARFLD